MQFLSSHPHHVGSAQDKANAEYMANLFRSWGYQTEIASYYVLFPNSKTRLLELTVQSLQSKAAGNRSKRR